MASSTVIPQWLDEQFIERALREGEENNKIKVRKIDVQPAIAPGENFFSVIFRASVDYDRNNGFEGTSRTLIVKGIPDVDIVKKMIVDNDAFTLETEVVRRIIPSFQLMLDTSSKETIKLGPKCYYHTDKPDHKIVMEDLCESGFKLAEKIAGLDLDHSKLVVSRLGTFHAASVALHRQEPQSFDIFLDYPKLKNADIFGIMLKRTFDTVATSVQAVPVIGEKYAEKFRQIGASVVPRTYKSIQRDEEGFNVLNHGDLWINNMMFRYNEDGKLSDMTFIDFQCCYYGSPAIDLLYFLYSTPSSEVRRDHFDKLLECYHSSLSKTLTTLGCSNKCPTLEDIIKDLEKRSFMGVLSAIAVMPLRFFKASDMPELYNVLNDFSTIESFDVSKLELFNRLAGPYITEIVRLLQIFDQKGYLD